MILYLDPFAGISGDMFLGLMFDLGVPVDVVRRGLEPLGLEGWSLATCREKRRGIEGTRALVETSETSHRRTWADIDAMLADSPLDEAPRELARRIFRRLGEAEATVHGIPLEQVHFHEVGALDAIVDIVGAALAITHLAPQRVICGSLPISSGTVKTAHGVFPLPAPATLKLLEGWPLKPVTEEMEWVTPTGAAIVTTIASPGPLPEMTLIRSGHGVGSRDPESIPNVLRGLLGEDSANGDCDQVTVLETHLDDARPEWLGALMEQLLDAGALDASFSPLQMKKNRPATRLTVICTPTDAQRLAELILVESSAIGVRFTTAQRRKLRREVQSISTPLGAANVKLIYRGEQLLRITAEHDSCLQLATASGRTLPEVYRIVERSAEQLYPLSGDS